MALADDRYVSLLTFRRDGREVRTPVWIASAGSALYVYTNAKSWKVKRVRHTPRVRLAPCDARGRLRADARWTDATAGVVEDPKTQGQAFDALYAKYGWQMRLLAVGAKLGGTWKDRCILEIRATRA